MDFIDLWQVNNMLHKKKKQQLVFERMIRDRAEVSELTEDQEYGKIIGELLGKTEYLPIIETLYHRKGGMREAIAAYWEISIGNETNEAESVVDFMMELAQRSEDYPDISNVDYYHFLGQLQSLRHVLAYRAKLGDISAKNHLRILDTLIDQYNKCEPELRMRIIYLFIKKHCENLRGDIYITNLLLASTCVQRNWQNTPIDRLRFVEILSGKKLSI